MVGYHEEHRQHELHLRKNKKYLFDSTPEYDPDDPDANEDGYVELPNVDLVMEMTDLWVPAKPFPRRITAQGQTKECSGGYRSSEKFIFDGLAKHNARVSNKLLTNMSACMAEHI